MKIFTSKQIHELDSYTIEHEPVASIDLMERAAREIAKAVMQRWQTETPIVVFAGPGNNGGDALAVARMLAEEGYSVTAFLFNVKNSLSPDCYANKQRLSSSKHMKRFVEVVDEFDPPELNEATLVIDGLFGSGLNKPLTGGFASLVKYINSSDCRVASIDMPSGLLAEDNTYNISSNIIRADITLTLHSKKLCMYLADCQQYLGEIAVLPIGLSEEWQKQTDSQFAEIEESDILPLVKQRNDFSHKGTMGHALIIAGSYGMGGAATMTAKACLRAGAGKVTVHIPHCNYNIMQIAVPEAVVHLDKEECCFSESIDTTQYDAVAIGPGLGQRNQTATALLAQLKRTECPAVLDADALNILSTRAAWMQQIPAGAVLTPHPKEFDRMDGNDCFSDFERLAHAREMAQRIKCYILLKGHYSAICNPDGTVIFNSTGNAGMATAGAGDVLTGIIAGLIARGYHTATATLLGAYIHGLAGDIAAEEKGMESLIATDIIEAMPAAFKKLYS